MKDTALLPIIMAILVLTGTIVHAFEAPGGDSSATIDIRVTGTARVQFAAGEGPNIEVSAWGEGDTHFHFTSAAGTVFAVEIIGEGEAFIEVTGPSELNLNIEGPSEVQINAGDEVVVNVQIDDGSKVFLNEQVIALLSEVQDEGLLELNESEGEAAFEANQEQVITEKVHAARPSNRNLKIMAGIVPALAITAFFFRKKIKIAEGLEPRRRRLK